MQRDGQTISSKSGSGWAEVWDWVKSFLIAGLIVGGIYQFVASPYQVKGESMDHTLANGERLIVDRVPYYFSLPKRGDIIVFHGPDGDDWVKRVIGLPGDTVLITKGHVFLNGKELTEPYINGPMDPAGDFGPTKVPAGELYVMGDNRNISEDSRYIGPVPVSKVVGRVDLVLWPFDHFQVIGSSQEHFLPQG